MKHVIVWRGDIATAIAICICGWSTEEEKVIFDSAQAFMKKVRDEAMARLVPAACDKCGHKLP